MFVRSARLGYPRFDRTRLRLKRGYLSTPQKGAAALAVPLKIKIVEIFYVSLAALESLPWCPPNDRKRVRSRQVGHWFTGLTNLFCKFRGAAELP